METINIPSPIKVKSFTKLSRTRTDDMGFNVKLEADFVIGGLNNEYNDDEPMTIKETIDFELYLFASGSSMKVNVTEDDLTKMLDYVQKIKQLAKNNVPINLHYEGNAQ